jgi:hypothetical protein
MERRSLQQSRTVSGDHPPKFKNPSPEGMELNNYTCTPPAPTEASAIFTPGPMVEEMEIFFM